MAFNFSFNSCALSRKPESASWSIFLGISGLILLLS
jgi:hypothetical protein